MKKSAPFLLFLLLPVLLQAQDLQTESRHYLAKLGVTSSDITKIIQIQTNARHQVRGVQLELNVLKAELDKALFPIDVDMKTVQRLLQASLQLKMKSELASIQERVALHKILGDLKYAAYRKFLVDATRRTHVRSNKARNAGKNP
jgi:hypothetical protein